MIERDSPQSKIDSFKASKRYKQSGFSTGDSTPLTTKGLIGIHTEASSSPTPLLDGQKLLSSSGDQLLDEKIANALPVLNAFTPKQKASMLLQSYLDEKRRQTMWKASTGGGGSSPDWSSHLPPKFRVALLPSAVQTTPSH